VAAHPHLISAPPRRDWLSTLLRNVVAVVAPITVLLAPIAAVLFLTGMFWNEEPWQVPVVLAIGVGSAGLGLVLVRGTRGVDRLVQARLGVSMPGALRAVGVALGVIGALIVVAQAVHGL
jgi:hypothetical protein